MDVLTETSLSTSLSDQVVLSLSLSLSYIVAYDPRAYRYDGLPLPPGAGRCPRVERGSIHIHAFANPARASCGCRFLPACISAVAEVGSS